MTVSTQFEKQGLWLFRWRSFLPLILFPILIAAIGSSGFIERILGDVFEDVFEMFAIAVAFFGLAIRAYTIGHVPVGTSGRNTTQQVAQTLNTTGIYSVVRHPLYLANFLIYLGVVLYAPVWWFLLLYVFMFIAYYGRIMYAEEAFLRGKFGDTFVEWAESTPTFIPDFSKWRPSELPFSFRHVLKREYAGLFAIIVSFAFVEFMGDWILEGDMTLDAGWTVFLLGGLVVFLTLRFFKKNTTLLQVDGR